MNYLFYLVSILSGLLFIVDMRGCSIVVLIGMPVVVIVISIMAPYVLKVWTGASRIKTYPTEFPGRYYQVDGMGRFIFSSGIWPFPHFVFFNILLMRDVPLKARAFAIAHEYAHRKYYHSWKIIAITITFMSIILSAGPLSHFFGLQPNIISGIFVFILSLILSFMCSVLLLRIRNNMENKADFYAMYKIVPSRHEIAKLFKYLRANKKYTRYHDPDHIRLAKMFSITPDQAKEILQAVDI